MPFLVILKRFEVWLLLGVVAALLYYALNSPPTPSEAPPRPLTSTPATLPKEPPSANTATPPDSPLPASSPIVLQECRLIESGGGYILETVLEGRSPTGEDLLLDESSTRAISATGEPVARFFEPFREAAQLSGTEISRATLRWWLQTLPQGLTIEVASHPIPVEVP